MLMMLRTFILILFTLFLTACFNEQKEPIQPKKILLEGNASDEYYYLAQKYFLEGEYQKALGFHLQQLVEDLKYYEEESLEIALNYNNIGLDYDELNNHEKALEYYLKSMKIDKITLEQNSTERSATYFNVASSYMALKKYDNAVTYYLKALRIDEKLLGKYNENVFAEYESLALAYGHLSKPNLSLKYWKKTLAYKEHLYGKYDAESNETREEVKKVEKQLR